MPFTPWQQVVFDPAVAEVVMNLIGSAAITLRNTEQSFHLGDCEIGYFFCKDPATTEIYTLSLHDALPIPAVTECRLATPVTRATWIHSSTVRLRQDRKSTRLNSSHVEISYAVFCLKKKKKIDNAFDLLEQIKINNRQKKD